MDGEKVILTEFEKKLNSAKQQNMGHSKY